MDRAHEAGLERVKEPIDVGIVSPNGKRAMIELARGLKLRGTPTVIDPGQGLPLFERDELVELIDGADVFVVNDYEWSLTLSRSALSEEDLLRRVGAVVVTRGEKGSTLRRGRRRRRHPARARRARGGPDRLRRRVSRGLPARALARAAARDVRPHGQPDGLAQGRRAGHAEPLDRPGRVPGALRRGLRKRAVVTHGARKVGSVRDLLWLLGALAVPLPWLLAVLQDGAGLSHEVITPLAGVAIVGAAFLLSWAVELAELDIPQSLAILVLALISVLPEYAVDLHFAIRRRERPELRALRRREHDRREPV